MDMGLFWLITAAVIAVNGLIFRARAERYGAQSPDLREGYTRLANGFMAWLIPPALLIAAGVFAGWSSRFAAQPGRPSRNTAFDLFCQVMMLAILGRSIIWVFFQEGAEFIATYRRVLHPAATSTSPRSVRIYWGAMSALAVVTWYLQLFT